ncbi:MAG: hypothetical protein LBJ73_05430 [Rickettsiales bacterium]|jgi:hypothetical protein|nr:hypothetical protein [Rickettsiales bacterium]
MQKTKYIWKADGGENMCGICAALDGTEYASLEDVSELPHPNCKCMIKNVATNELIRPHPWTGRDAPKTRYGDSIYIKADGTRSVHPAWNSPFNRAHFSPNGMEQLAKWNKAVKEELEKDMKNEKNFEIAYEKLKEPEGGYTPGTDQIKDEPTKFGIKQSTLSSYSKKYPDKEFPKDVFYLQRDQAKDIYKEVYWDETDIPKIENDRVRDAVFDMNVMGGAGSVAQKALNSYANAGVKVDGYIGDKTIKALNSIPDSEVPEFMKVLKAERFNYLQGIKNWPTAQRGWTKRTNNY